MDMESDVSVKDIVNFYIKINDSSKAKNDIAKLSAKDKATAFDIIAASAATREFRIDVANHFIYDLNTPVRKKAERFMEELVPGWVTDPAESILQLLKSADGKGEQSRNSAVKFLFGIVDSGNLRDTIVTLLNVRNRDHLAEIISILENYIESSLDERELVKIFDACLDIVISDGLDNNIKHQASDLLSVFFKKVRATEICESLKCKFIEKQVEKAEGVYRYLCSGAYGLNSTYMQDLLRPLNDGGTAYQLKILNYFKTVMEKVKNSDEVDTVLDTHSSYWGNDDEIKEVKVRAVCGQILRAADELWEVSEDRGVRELIVRIRFGEYANKRELLEQIRVRADEITSDSAREKMAMMLLSFLSSDEQDSLKLLASQLLLFKIGDSISRLAALEFLVSYVENKSLNYAEKGSIASVTESLLTEKNLEEGVREKAQYLLSISSPGRLQKNKA